MYEKIHGPIPQTPNGSHDTPRLRNRKHRDKSADSEQVPARYDACSEWTNEYNDVMEFSSTSYVRIDDKLKVATTESQQTLSRTLIENAASRNSNERLSNAGTCNAILY